MKKIAVCYHSGCLDGFSGAYAAWKIFGNQADYFPLEHQEEVPRGLRNKKAYFIDFCYPAPVMKKVIAANREVIVLDHHESQVNAIKLASEYRYTTDHSGCVIAWHYFHPKKKIPLFFRIIEDNDLFRFVLPDTKVCISAVQYQEQTFNNFDILVKNLETKKGQADMRRDGGILQQAEQTMILRLIATAEKIIFEGFTVYAVNSPLYYSQIANVISREKKVPFGLTWYYRNGKVNVSLRSSKHSIDLSQLAKKYGGGGHIGAAGFNYIFKGTFPWKVVK